MDQQRQPSSREKGLPSDDSEWLCDDGRIRTWRDMVAGVDHDLRPVDAADAELLADLFGASEIWKGSGDSEKDLY